MSFPLFSLASDLSGEVQGDVDSIIQQVHLPLQANRDSLHQLLDSWLTGATNLGIRVVVAIVLFFIGRFVIGKIQLVVRRMLERKKLDGVAVGLINSVATALLYLILGIILVSTLGIKSVSFAAVLGSLGLAVGMSLSGQLQNLAGGIILMLTRPFKIGDYIQAQGVEGTVKEVTLFHTKISSGDNKSIFIPNGVLSSGVVVNISHLPLRRVEWTIGVEYDEDFGKVQSLIAELLRADSRIQQDPAPLIVLGSLSASSVDVLVRVWVHTSDYWDVYWGFNRTVYEAFNKAGIGFPFPQLTVHTPNKD